MTFEEWWLKNDDQDPEWLEDFEHSYEGMKALAKEAWEAAKQP